MRLRPALATIAAGLAAVASVAIAADTKPGTVSRKYMSRTELRACLDRQSDLNRTSARLAESMTQHEATLDGVSAEANELAEVLRTLDTTDERAVDAFNRRNDDRNARVEELNKRAATLNSALETYRAAMADFMAECASKPYIKADEEAILRERGQQNREPLPGDLRPARKSRQVTI